MAELSMERFTDTVINAIGPNASPRVREVMTALIRHLHDFAREVKLTTPEYLAACDFVVNIGKISDEKRNEAILASDVFHSGGNVETLLFGSLLLVDSGDIAFAAVATAIVLAGAFVLEQRWLAAGFDPGSARGLGARSALPDGVLLALVALVAVAALSTLGALLATAILVVPAATESWRESILRPISYPVAPPFTELAALMREEAGERQQRQGRTNQGFPKSHNIFVLVLDRVGHRRLRLGRK